MKDILVHHFYCFLSAVYYLIKFMPFIIIYLVIIILIFGCTEQPVVNLEPPVHPLAGEFVIHSQDPLPGSATIKIRENGKIENGILIDKIAIWIDGTVDPSGSFTGKFWNDDSVPGKITGIFTRSVGAGIYSIKFDSVLFHGTWYAKRTK